MVVVFERYAQIICCCLLFQNYGPSAVTAVTATVQMTLKVDRD